MYIINIALEMEKVGKEYYEKLAEETSLTGVKNIFKMLAVEQQKLYDIFKAIENDEKTPLFVDSNALERAMIIFAQLFNEASKGILRTDLVAYNHAMELESDIADLFKFILPGYEAVLSSRRCRQDPIRFARLETGIAGTKENPQRARSTVRPGKVAYLADFRGQGTSGV